MDTNNFARLLAAGSGRVILYLDDHDAGPYRETILDACLRTIAYDPGCEGSRAPYLLDIIRRTGEEAFYREPTLAALAAGTAGGVDVTQLIDFGRLFAAAGHEPARQALAAAFLAATADPAFTTSQGAETAEALIRLDGLAGLLAVARRFGHRVALGGSVLFDTDCRDQVIPGQPAATAWHALEMAAASDADIAAYLAYVRLTAAAQPAAPADSLEVEELSYAELRPLLAAGDPRLRGWLAGWGEGATEADLELAAADLLAAATPERLAASLELFHRWAFPLDPTPLLALAASPDPALAAAALGALGPVAHPDVRALALHLLAAGRRAAGVGLLVGNYRAGDLRLLAAAVEAEETADGLHELAYRVRAVVEAHPERDQAPVLLTLYERGPCSRCRDRDVALLHALGGLPDWIIDECLYDANVELRERVLQYRDLGASPAIGCAVDLPG